MSTLRSADGKEWPLILCAGWTTYEPDPLLYLDVWLDLIERVLHAVGREPMPPSVMLRWSTHDRGPHIVAGVAELARRVATVLTRNGVELEDKGIEIVDPSVHSLT